MIHRLTSLALSLSLTALTCCACIGCNEAAESVRQEMYKQAIQKVLRESNLTGTSASNEHVASLKTIDLQNCPPDFRFAFMKYVHAWEEESAVHKAELKVNDDELSSAGGELLARVFDLDAKPWQDHQQAIQQVNSYKAQAESDLAGTARDLNDLSVKYGLNMAK